MGLKFWKKKPVGFNPTVPERNDKQKSINRKNNWDLLILIYGEAVVFSGFFMGPLFIINMGFMFGLIVTLALLFLCIAVAGFLQMYQKNRTSEKLGVYDAVNLIAFNLLGKKYEDHFFEKNVEEIHETIDIKSAPEPDSEEPKKPLPDGENPTDVQPDAKDPQEPLLGSDRLFKVTGAYREGKPLEQFMVRTLYAWGEHLEKTDCEETVYHGAVGVRKSMPTLILRQIGTYSEHNLPLMRVESSAVSRRDKPLFTANLKKVVKSMDAEDSWVAAEKEKEIHSLQKQNKALRNLNDQLLDDLETVKMLYKQKDEVGEEKEPEEEPSRFQMAKPYILIFGSFVAGCVVTFLYLKAMYGF